MNKYSIRYAAFALLVLIFVAGPGVPRGAKPPRGVGCSGGARVTPKVPSGGMKVVPKPVIVRKVEPKLIPRVPPERPLVRPGEVVLGPKDAPKLPGLHPEHVPHPPGINGQSQVLRGAAAARDWALFVDVARFRPAELSPAEGLQLNALEANASGLKALGGLRDLVHNPWPNAVSFGDVEAGVRAHAETASPQEAALMRRYLVLRAKMEDRPEIARQLMRPGADADPQSVLRDLKALAESNAPPPPTSPLGGLPLPEPEPLGLKAPVREALNKDLPGLVDELPAAELRARRGALCAIETSAGVYWDHVTISLHNLKAVTASSDPDDREDEVEHQVGRPLTPEERLLARRLLRTKNTAEVVAVLRSMEQK
jgi:hypothetical protein